MHRCIRVLSAPGLAMAVLLTGAATAIGAGPMDMAKLESRWVRVQVVTSDPGERGLALSAPVLAWYEVASDPCLRTVTIPGPEVERLFLSDRRPVANSFSDFVWVFDAETGEVLSASFSGLVEQPIQLGLVHLSVRVSLEVAMSTRVAGGYTPEQRLAGHRMVGYCLDSGNRGCREVPSMPYQKQSGWVRANGPVRAVWRGFHVLAYTTLGQARFQELDPAGGGIEGSLANSAPKHP